VEAAEARAAAALGPGVTAAAGRGSTRDRAAALVAAAGGFEGALRAFSPALVYPDGLSGPAADLAAAAAAQVAPAFAARGVPPPSAGDVVLARAAALLARFECAGEAGGDGGGDGNGGEAAAPLVRGGAARDAALLGAAAAGTHALNPRAVAAVRLRAGRVAVLQAAAAAVVGGGGGGGGAGEEA
jgi:hypothetical protein